MISFFDIFSQKFIFEFQNFPERTKKEEIDALLSSYHIETTHTDKNNESCKVTHHQFTDQVTPVRRSLDGSWTPTIFSGNLVDDFRSFRSFPLITNVEKVFETEIILGCICK